MNTTIRTLVLAAPLATAALALSVAPATADQVDKPVITLPAPDPQPEPFGPDEITNPTPGDPDPIDDFTNPEVDDDPEVPDGPDTITNPEPCPTHGTCGDNPGGGGSGTDDPNEGGGSGTDQPGEDSSDTDEVSGTGSGTVVDVERPTRVDAGVGATDDGMALGWLLASGALVTATGAAFGARRWLA